MNTYRQSKWERARPKSPSAHRTAVIERLKTRTSGAGGLSVPCVPALYEHYLDKLLKLFDVLDRPFTGPELQVLGRSLRDALETGFRRSPHSRCVVSYRPSETDPRSLDYAINIVSPSLEESYEAWFKTNSSKQPFGTLPDARVMDVARTFTEPQMYRALDIGAGTGRNSFPLARLGMQVDALEPMSELCARFRTNMEGQSLNITLLQADVLLDSTSLPASHYGLIVLSEVATHFSQADLQRLIPRLAQSLTTDGKLLFNAFITKRGYLPDPVAEQVAQSVWSTFFTPQALARITEPAGLRLISDELCSSYEAANLPSGSWPPTTWYEHWSSGHNLFAANAGDSPIELRWLEYQRRAD